MSRNTLILSRIPNVTQSCLSRTHPSHLISVQFAVALILLSLFLKGKDDKSYENVDEEKRENYNKENVEKSNLDFVVHDWATVDGSCVDGGLHESKREQKNKGKYKIWTVNIIVLYLFMNYVERIEDK